MGHDQSSISPSSEGTATVEGLERKAMATIEQQPRIPDA